MAASNISSFQIGNSFINLYYQVLRETPEISHHFYDDFCTITRIDADHTQTVSTRLGIHSLLTSLSVTNVEVTRLNAQQSWFGGIFLIVSGIIWSRNFCGKRKFLQAFFLAPQSIKSFRVMNEIFQFQDEEVVELPPVPELPVIMVDSQVPPYNRYDQQPAISVSRYELEETTEYADSLHMEDDRPIDKYSLPDDQQHVDLQFETVVEEASVEQSSPLQSVVNHLEDAIHRPELPPASARVDELAVKPAVESAGEPAIVSYASILQAPKRQSSQPCVHRQPSVRQSMPAASTSSFVPQVAGTGADDNLVQEVEPTSVFVGRLPSHVTISDLHKEFKNFGKIKPNGVVIKNKTETGGCYAFVEFEDKSGAHNAIKASPINLLSRQVYIDKRRSSSSTSARAAPRGRGKNVKR